MVACCVVFAASTLHCAVASGAKPDAFDLLRGVEKARKKLKSGRAKIAVVKRSHDGDRHETKIRLDFLFSGANRSFVQRQRELIVNGLGPEADENLKKLKAMRGDREKFVKAGLGNFKDAEIRTVVAGDEVLTYTRGDGTTIKDTSASHIYYGFDPRVLGISVWHSTDRTIRQELSYPIALSIELLGREKLNGHSTWRVRVVDKYQQQYTYWIENVEGFPMHRVEMKTPFQRRRITAKYNKKGTAWPLPERVVLEEFKRPGLNKVASTVTYDISNVEFGIPVEASRFTLAGLKMAKGVPVADIRIRRRIGYWDGRQVVPNLPK